jgi:DHA1 family bicyclomycin/chloramphenicol resistance-like MFS transporter
LKIIILILGALSTVSPLSIDMYLPAFGQMAAALSTTPARISLSLSSYFVGLSVGQLFYGPFLDRFGRKRPLYLGLALFIFASFGCVTAPSVEALIAFRFLQALGGCAAQVASMTLVRDLFPPREVARTFSLLMLILGVSPLLAPTLGGFIVTTFGWQSVFLILAAIVAFIWIASYFWLPAGRSPDSSVRLNAKSIAKEYLAILRHPVFSTFAFTGAFSFAGLFVYVAGSPIIFMDVFQVSARNYGAIFAFLSVGFIGGSQLNIQLSKRFAGEQVFRVALRCQLLCALVFLGTALAGSLGLVSTIAFLWVELLCLGLISPNASAMSLAPFARNAGSASALLGFVQRGIGAAASAGVGLLGARSVLPVIAVLAATSIAANATLGFGSRKLNESSA